jgi:BASS family bile acid:Na+ symporter
MAAPSAQGSKLFLFAAIAAAVSSALCWAAAFEEGIGLGVIGAMVLLALYWRNHPTLRVITLTLWLCVSTGAGLFWPQYFQTWNGFNLNSINLYLVQTIMFCMGATLSIADFTSALRMPKAVLTGMILQFSVMPGVGWFLAESFGFDPDVAAGIILVGSCSGGVSSNLMVYLARGNVALSVTMTACSTLLAPLMTPLLMKYLAGHLVEVDFWAMVLSIVNLVIIPIGGGLIVNLVSQRRRPIAELIRGIGPLSLGFGVGVALLFGAIQVMGGATMDSSLLAALARQGVILFALVSLLSLLVNATIAGQQQTFQKFPPVVSIVALCCFLVIVTAGSRDDLLSAGLLLVVAVALHNIIGIILGYWLAPLAGIHGHNRRTVAFEVGLQNSGMAGGLALSVLKSAGAVLAPVVFSTVMNVNASLLASWWRDRPPTDEPAA